MPSIDLNCDLGEGFGAYAMEGDESILPLITSANIACGFHAGDPLTMGKTMGLCRRFGVHAGAHPGLPDLMGFGRRRMDVSAREAADYVTYQTGAAMAFCRRAGIPLAHVKLHGALYNMAAKDYELSRAICEAIRSISPSLVFLALSGSQMVKAAKDAGLKYACEVYADRAYRPDGSLVPRTMEGAMIEDEGLAARRVARMVLEGVTEAVDGTVIPIQADSVCVHGDSPRALEFVKQIRRELAESGIEVGPI